MRVVPILHNIRSAYNVGAILRTAEGFGCGEAIFSGYTPFPGAREGVLPYVAEKLARQIGKTALGAEKLVDCKYVTDIGEFLRSLRQEGTPVVALENRIEDERLMELAKVGEKLGAGERVYLLLGEEVEGIPKELFSYVTVFAEIPMRGRKESFNVSVAAGVALYVLTGLDDSGKSQ